MSAFAPRRTRAQLIGAAAFAVLAWARGANAQPADDVAAEPTPEVPEPASPDLAQDEARVLFDRGVALSDRGDWAAACLLFEQANERFTSGGTRLRLADCYEHIGEDEKARDVYRGIVLDASAESVTSRIEIARERLRAVEERIAARAKPTPEPAAPRVAAPPESADDDGAGLTPIPGAVVLGVGGVGLVIGAIFGGMALSEESKVRDQCVDGRCPASAIEAADAASTKARVADVSFAIGGVCAAVGIALLVVSATTGSDDTATGIGPGGWVLRF